MEKSDERLITGNLATLVKGTSDVSYDHMVATVVWESYLEYRKWGLRGVVVAIKRVICHGDATMLRDGKAITDPWSIDVDDDTEGWTLHASPVSTRWDEDLAPHRVEVDLVTGKIEVQF